MATLFNDEGEGLNLIDLKGSETPSAMATEERVEGNALYDFSRLTLVEKPTSQKNSKSLQQTLEDCIGYLRFLPLKQPNADQNNPISIINMANILANPAAEAEFATAMNLPVAPKDINKMDVYSFRKLQEQVLSPDSQVYQMLMAQVRKKTTHIRAYVTGQVVRSGCVSIYSREGITYAVGEGRWGFPTLNVRSGWTKYQNITLDSPLIRNDGSNILIIRVQEGEVGLVIEQGVHKLLDVGTHVYNSGTVAFVGKQSFANCNYFQHGPYNYLNVPRGWYAKVWVEVETRGRKAFVPRMLKEGEHFIMSSVFKFEGLVAVSSPVIGHGSVHIINVSKGHVVPVFHDNFPRLLGEGNHVIESTNFQATTAVSVIDNLHIVHGTITILRVPRGKIAVAWYNNEPFFIDVPGLYEFNSEDFNFVDFKDANDREIELGAKKVIQVYTGEVGITYQSGKLEILKNGRHVIDSSTHIFERFLSTKQRSIRLVSLAASEKFARSSKKTKSKTRTDFSQEFMMGAGADEDSDMLVCETKDLVKVGVRADVFYSITDPEKCIRTLETDELEDLVRETAVATLTNIIRSTALNQIAQSKNISASGSPHKELHVEAIEGEDPAADDAGDPVQPAVALFFDRAHDEFMSKLHDDFIQRYGVDIANIRMEAFKIIDIKLAEQISMHVLTTAQVENELANLEGQSLIATQKERTSAEVRNIKTGSQAESLKTEADAKNERRIEEARAEAEAMRIQATAKAEAEAETILARARAEAEAISRKAKAEAERAELLSQTSLGEKERLLCIYADMVASSNEGVQKVVYLDPSVNRESPFALGSLDGLNRDLHSLSKLGVAANDRSIEN